VPAARDPKAQREWLKSWSGCWRRKRSHGGPIAYVEGKALAIDALRRRAAGDRFAHRSGCAGAQPQGVGGARGALLWEDVEDTLIPAGQEVAELPSAAGDRAGGEAGEHGRFAAERRCCGVGAILPGSSVRLPSRR
jgi:hypothetical protein